MSCPFITSDDVMNKTNTGYQKIMAHQTYEIVDVLQFPNKYNKITYILVSANGNRYYAPGNLTPLFKVKPDVKRFLMETGEEREYLCGTFSFKAPEYRLSDLPINN